MGDDHVELRGDTPPDRRGAARSAGYPLGGREGGLSEERADLVSGSGATGQGPDDLGSEGLGVLETVARLIREVIGEEWVEEITITRATSFSDDLELESIEFVALAEKLQECYGDDVDFVGWLSAKELDEIIALDVGQLVAFIESCVPA